MFGEILRPDLTCSRAARNIKEESLFIVSVCNQQSVDEMVKLQKSLRYVCISEKKQSVHGILTNFDSWTFARYDLVQEIRQAEA